MRAASLLVMVAALAAGCAAGRGLHQGSLPRGPARIQHVVLFSLDDHALAAAMLADSDATVPGIPGVSSYASGTALDLGRPGVLTDFDVGFVIGFTSERALAKYLDHPDHRALAARWRPHVTSARIFDVTGGD